MEGDFAKGASEGEAPLRGGVTMRLGRVLSYEMRGDYDALEL